MSRTALSVILMPFLALLSPALAAEELSLFDWLEMAPTVVSGEAQEQNGKHTEFRVERVLRGEAQAGGSLLIDLRHANRYRDYNVDPRPLKLDSGHSYVILLQKDPSGKRNDLAVYRLVRGPRGARELPAEGSQAVLGAMERFIMIQNIGDDRIMWGLLGEMLEETNSILVETALGQFLKFRRGDTDLLPAVLPLLDHPSAGIRVRSCKLIGQIVSRYGAAGMALEEKMLGAIAARARRDEEVAVRIAATEALGSFAAGATTEILEEIATEDPDQAVRYVAETILLDRRSAIDFQKDAAYDRSSAQM